MVRSLVRSIARVLGAPPVVGALWVLGLAGWAGQRGAGDDSDLGDLRRAEAMEAFIQQRFGGEIVRMKIGIVATAVAFGLVIGLVADVLVRLRGGKRRTVGWTAVESLFVVAALHAIIVLHAMAEVPQLYASRWYARGGVPRTIQVFATDVLGPWGIAALGVLALVVYVRPAALVGSAKRLARFPRRWRIGAALLVFGCAGAWAQADGQGTPSIARVASIPDAHAAPPSSPTRPNVLVLAADSFRADRLEPKLAPNLTALAARGTRFDRAYVSLPRTFPSWVTILTGRHAHHHGIRTMFPTWEDRAKDFDALPQRLAREGYRTSVISDYAGDIFGRIDLGFRDVLTPSFDFRQLIRQRALERETPLLPVLHSRLGRAVFPVMRELNDAADPRLLAADVERELARVKDGPFFMTVFFSTAHFPYASPAPYYAKYTERGYRGRFKYHKPVGLGEEAPPDAEDIAQIRGLYDGAINAIDTAIGRVLASLASLGLADRTIVVVTADHGETLFDDGHGQGHGDHLFGDEGTHVPLVIYDPRAKRPGRTDAIVRDVDIAPTLYALTGVAAPPDVDGASLAASLDGGALAAPRLAFAETELWFTEEIPAVPPSMRLPYPGIMGLTELDARHNAEIVLRRDVTALTTMARHRMVRDARWKLVYVPTRSGVRYLLFDLEHDPSEHIDVADAHPAEVKRLSAELWSWMLQDPRMEQRDGFLVPRRGEPR